MLFTEHLLCTKFCLGAVDAYLICISTVSQWVPCHQGNWGLEKYLLKVILKKKVTLLFQNRPLRNLGKIQVNLPSLAKMFKNKKPLGWGSQIPSMNKLSSDAI